MSRRRPPADHACGDSCRIFPEAPYPDLIQERGAGLPVPGAPEDLLYPFPLFTDAIDHLGRTGRRLRSERLVSLPATAPGVRLACRQALALTYSL